MPPVRRLEEPDTVAVGAGEGAATMAEELALEQRLRHGGAVDGEERPAPARAHGVDGARHQLLAGPRLALDQDGDGRAGGLGHQAEDRLHGRTGAHDGELVARLLARHGVVVARRRLRLRALARRVHEGERHRADLDDVAVAQPLRQEHAPPVQVGAVRAAQVAQQVGAVLVRPHHGVMAGHVRLVEDDGVPGRPPDRGERADDHLHRRRPGLGDDELREVHDRAAQSPRSYGGPSGEVSRWRTRRPDRRTRA